MIKTYCDMCEKEIEVVEGTPKDELQSVMAVLIREPSHEKVTSILVEICPRCYEVVKNRFRRLFAAEGDQE